MRKRGRVPFFAPPCLQGLGDSGPVPFFLAVLGLVVLFAGCHASSDGLDPDEDRVLEKLMERYVSARFDFYPVESTLAGLPGNDGRLGSYDAIEFGRRIRWLSDFEQRLVGVRLTKLSRSSYVDALWLTSLVKAELFDLEEHRRWRRTAAFYGDTLRMGLATLLLDRDLPEKSHLLGARLEAVPELVRQARANLRPSSPLWRSDGLRSLGRCRDLLRDLPKMLEPSLPAPRVAELADRSRAAARAIQEWIDVVSSSGAPPEAAVPEGAEIDRRLADFALGEEGLARFFLYSAMEDAPLASLVEEAERELERLTNAMTEIALREFPGGPLPRLVSGGREPLDAASVVEQAASSVREFLRERGVKERADVRVPVHEVADYLLAPEALFLWRPAALSPAREAFLVLSRPVRLDPLELELLTLRELGGRYRQYSYQSGSASLLRRVFAAPTTRDGWLGLYVTRLLEDGYREGDAKLRLLNLHRSLVDILRLRVVVGLHTGALGFSRAEEMFRQRGFLARDRARLETERAAADPSAAHAGLGRLSMRALSKEYFRAFPLKTASELDELMLSQGMPPERLLRFELLPF